MTLTAFVSALCATTLTLAPTVSGPTEGTRDGHGKLPWFSGTYEQLLEKAAAEDRVIFLDFWTDW